MTVRLRIDLDALADNYHRFQARQPGAAIGGVVKADAYGLGMSAVAPRLWTEGCRDFFVAIADEGLALRTLLPEARIFVFEGATARTAAALANARLIPVLNHRGQLECWQPYRHLPTAVQVETGMMRLGFDADLGAEDFTGFDIALLMTHLACADEAAHPMNRHQVERFSTVRKRFPGVKCSIGNSAGLLLGADYCGDLGRPGIGLYGGNPVPASSNPMRCVARLTAPVLQVMTVEKGTPIGYGAAFVTKAGMRIATLGLGYADGLPRCLSNRGLVAFKDARFPIIGQVSMDLTTIDVTGSTIAVGDEVEIFGSTVAVDEVAAWADTIAYEILTGIGRRVVREHHAMPVADGTVCEVSCGARA